jgi:hypothetical protein
MAHSKLAKIAARPSALTSWKALSYSLPHTPHFAMELSTAGSLRQSSAHGIRGAKRTGDRAASEGPFADEETARPNDRMMSSTVAFPRAAILS